MANLSIRKPGFKKESIEKSNNMIEESNRSNNMFDDMNVNDKETDINNNNIYGITLDSIIISLFCCFINYF
jgi:hypothetical protein